MDKESLHGRNNVVCNPIAGNPIDIAAVTPRILVGVAGIEIVYGVINVRPGPSAC